MMPKRIQRKRMKGWKMPEGAVYVGRPSRWGNPYKRGVHDVDGPRTAERCVSLFRFFFEANFGVFDKRTCSYSVSRDTLNELRGKDLCCWCPLDAPCHADVLLELANGESA